jgi:hypothetical protein
MSWFWKNVLCRPLHWECDCIAHDKLYWKGGAGELLRDKIAEIAFALTTERDPDKLVILLNRLKSCVETIPTEEPKSEWQIALKSDLLNEITSACNSPHREMVLTVVKSTWGVLASLNIRNKPK